MPVNSSEQLFFDKLAKQADETPPKPLSETSIQEFRLGTGIFLNYAGKAADIPYQNLTIPARDGYNLPIRIYNPNYDNTKPVLIFYPGCGYVCDLFESNAIAASRVAQYADSKVIVAQYRLAPEFPFPIPIQDAYDAAKYIAMHSNQFNIDPNKIIIGGLSSGAHVAAVISNLARKDNNFKILHQILLNGGYDLLFSNHDYVEYEMEDKLLTKEAINYIIPHWGIEDNDLSNPLYSPYYETDFSNLPSTTLIIGEYDGFRSDSEAYYQKLKLAGVNVERIILPGQTHNTIIMREVFTDGDDPAKVMADSIKKYF